MEGWSYALFALVFIGAATHADALAEDPRKRLDMAPSAVDDQFLTCRDRMLQSLMGSDGLLERELRNSEGFRAEWHKETCGSPIAGGVPEHLKALEIYVANSKFSRKFDDAVESQGSNASVYRGTFLYKTLHFLLTDAIHLLKEEGCRTLFRGSDVLYSTTKGAQVRFGTFSLAVDGKSVAEEDILTRGTLFNIMSCAAADIESYVCEHHTHTWLLPPYEVFRVADVQETAEYREIKLTHDGLSSGHKCSFFSEAPSSFSPLAQTGPLLPLAAAAAAVSVGLAAGPLWLSG